MKKQRIKLGRCVCFFAFVFCGLDVTGVTVAQQLRWMAVNDLQYPVNSVGANSESEYSFNQNGGDFLTWPAQYGAAATNDDQSMIRMEGVWIGVNKYSDPKVGKDVIPKVVGSGPRDPADRVLEVFPVSFELIGKYRHPSVTVTTGGTPNDASFLSKYESANTPVDKYDPTMAPDRMAIATFNTSVGITVTRKVMVFASSNDGGYIINDWVFKNTGIYDAAGDLNPQALDTVWFYWMYRYAFAGEGNGGQSEKYSNWASFNSQWGISTLNHDFGDYNVGKQAFEDASSPWHGMRGFYSYYGPDKGHPVTYDEDWGCPAQSVDGRMCSWKFSGNVVLHADKSETDRSDDISQPHTTWSISSDETPDDETANQYSISDNSARWRDMTEGYAPLPMDTVAYLATGGHYAADYTDQRHGSEGGGTSQGQGFGPYHLEIGDSVHIVFAQAVGGMSREKNLEVGANWVAYYNNSSKPVLTMPNGTQAAQTLDGANAYKKAWVFTGIDSLANNFRKAMNAYAAGYSIPLPPPPPQTFLVTSLGDRIKLQWSEEAESDPHFNGYVIYRSQGSSMNPLSVYTKVFECDKNNLPTATSGMRGWDDTKAARGFDYYYYIQAKDGGTQATDPATGNHVVLYSSLEWTVTTIAARLQRPAIPDYPPNKIPFTFSTMKWVAMNGPRSWTSGVKYGANDSLVTADWVTYNNANYVYVHVDTSGHGDSLVAADSMNPAANSTVWQKINLTGKTWVSGTAYKAFDAVIQNGVNYYTPFQISGGEGLDLVRVVPNPYDARSRKFQFGTDVTEQDKVAFFGLPADCMLKIFTERGDLIYSKHHSGSGDEVWYCSTTYNQIVASGIYILAVEKPDGSKVFRKFVIIR